MYMYVYTWAQMLASWAAISQALLLPPIITTVFLSYVSWTCSDLVITVHQRPHSEHVQQAHHTWLQSVCTEFWNDCCLISVISFIHRFLADRTNGRAYVSVASVVCLSVTLCIVAKRCVLQQKLLLTAYRKSYMRNRLVPKWYLTLTFV